MVTVSREATAKFIVRQIFSVCVGKKGWTAWLQGLLLVLFVTQLLRGIRLPVVNEQEPSTLFNKANRVLPFTDGTVTADLLWESPFGMFYLPRPPAHPMDGYETQETGNTFRTDLYKGRSGFVNDTHVNIIMPRDFNAGDFLSYFVAPMISGRYTHLIDTKAEGRDNRCALSLVGSILGWGIRYYWGPGFIEGKNKLQQSTERVFALRGPISFNQTLHTLSNPKEQSVQQKYGDPGLLTSWFYQPRHRAKNHSLCLIPHYADKVQPVINWMKRNKNITWDASNAQGQGALIMDIRAPLFTIMDQLVSCDFVLSTSLHGLIFSDSYQIPNAYLRISNRVQGGLHKFQDYFQAVGRNLTILEFNSTDLTNFTEGMPIAKMESFIVAQKKVYQGVGLNLVPLWESCPTHAEAYSRTREQHMEFARQFVQNFEFTSRYNRPKNYVAFDAQMKALAAELQSNATSILT